MSLMSWSNSYSVGIASIDDQHKKLIDMINELHDGMLAKKSREALGAVLERLILYTGDHFDYEEELFARTGYADSALHKAEHAKLKHKVIDIHERYKASTMGTLSLETLNFLRDWLTNHINGTDKKYTKHMLANNVT